MAAPENPVGFQLLLPGIMIIAHCFFTYVLIVAFAIGYILSTFFFFRGLRATPNNRSSVINAAVIRGPDKPTPSLPSSLTSPTCPEVQIPTQACSKDQHIERIVASGNHLPFLGGRLEHPTLELCSKDHQSNLKAPHIEGNLEPTSVVKDGIRESPDFSNSREIMRGTISLPCSLDSDGICQQVPDFKLDLDVSRNPRIVETAECSFPGSHSVAEGTSSEFGCLDVERSSVIFSCHPDAAVRQLDFPVASLQDSLHPKLRDSTVSPLPGVALTSSAASLDEQSSIGSEMGIKISSATDLDAKSMYLT